MSRWRLTSELRARYLLASISGIVLALAFPKFSIAGIAWIAPAGLLFSAAGSSGRISFRCGFVGGFCFYLATLYWLLHIPVPFVPILGWIALSAYVALYPACWVWLSWKIFPAKIASANYPWESSVLPSLLSASWSSRALWSLKCAALWVALEMVLARFLTGFPWEFLGVSQYRMIPIIQLASFTGVYGISFLIIWFSVCLLFAGLRLAREPANRGIWMAEIGFPVIVLVIISTLGFHSIRQREQPERTVKMALIQPSIPQTLIWDERENSNRFTQLLSLSREALKLKPDILVWPEASVPDMLRHHRETREAVRELVRKHKVWAILGSDDAEYRPGSLEREIDFFNSAFAVAPDGSIDARYTKRQLVIFGEYMPLANWFPFLKKISPAGEGSFTPGKEPIPFYLHDLDLRVSVLICFEDVFPHLVPEYVRPETDFLLNLTNNGWFGETAAQWQHAAAAVFRAVENRIPLVRCANNGLTCWVDETGAMHKIEFPDSSNIYKAGFKMVDVPALNPGEARPLSFYTRHGDLFGWICVGGTVLNLVAVCLRRCATVS